MNESSAEGRPAARLKVAIVSDYDFATGGIEVFVQQILKETVGVLDSTLVTWSSQGPRFEGPRRVIVEHGDVQMLWDTLAAADVLLVVTSFNVRALAWLAADYLRSASTPAVTVVHTSQHSSPDFMGESEQRRRLADLLCRSSATVAVSEDVAAALVDLVEDPSRLSVIENAARVLPPARKTRTRARGHRRISFIGRPHHQKGFEHFRRLAQELQSSGFEFAANTVSIPVDLDDPIEYSANLSDRQLRDFFDETDLLVAPYLRADGMPLALLEALTCGVPIVGYDSPGVGPLLRRYNQLVIRPQYGDLAAAIRAWGEGQIKVPTPEPSNVLTWQQSANAYVEVLRSAAAHHWVSSEVAGVSGLT